eukprot:1159949-Pelagomonas_calceolata.AAC.2
MAPTTLYTMRTGTAEKMKRKDPSSPESSAGATQFLGTCIATSPNRAKKQYMRNAVTAFQRLGCECISLIWSSLQQQPLSWARCSPGCPAGNAVSCRGEERARPVSSRTPCHPQQDRELAQTKQTQVIQTSPPLAFDIHGAVASPNGRYLAVSGYDHQVIKIRWCSVSKNNLSSW